MQIDLSLLIDYRMHFNDVIQYSRTSLIWTPKGQSKVSVLERCPLYRGHEYYVTLKAPLMVLSVL